MDIKNIYDEDGQTLQEVMEEYILTCYQLEIEDMND